VLCSLIRDSQKKPPVPMPEPASNSGRAPIRETSWALTRP